MDINFFSYVATYVFIWGIVETLGCTPWNKGIRNYYSNLFMQTESLSFYLWSCNVHCNRATRASFLGNGIYFQDTFREAQNMGVFMQATRKVLKHVKHRAMLSWGGALTEFVE